LPISIDWGTYVISIPQSYLTFVSGSTYTLDTEQFRLDLRALEESQYGIVNLKTHVHNTEVTIGGITYARFIEILAPYTVTFENGNYRVILQGSNNNIWDEGILNLNQVQVIPTNSAGLVSLTDQNKYWRNKLIIDPVTKDWVLYEDDGITVKDRWTLKDIDGNPITVPAGAIAQRIPQ
jgi:hypothetical protein